MDPLWVLVILVGVSVIVIAVAFVIIAVKVSGIARDLGPRVEQMGRRLAAVEATIQGIAMNMESAEGAFNRVADKVAAVTGPATRIVAAVPRVVNAVREAEIRTEATIRAVKIVAARSLARAGRKETQ